jgi:hypothetical protein
MEILLLILVVGIIVVVARRSGKASRLDRLEAELIALQERVGRLGTEVAMLAASPPAKEADKPEPAASMELAPPPTAARRIVMPTPAPAWRMDVPPMVEPVLPESPVEAPPLGEPAPIGPRRRIRRAEPEAGERAAAAATPVPIQLPPAGPGLVQRVLLKLGLSLPAEGERPTRAALEAWLEGRMLAVVGGIALLLGAVFFLSLAFSRGWITEPMRVLIGLAAGAGLLVLGELAFSKVRGILGHVLVAVGLAIVSLALLAATRLYDLVPVEWALAGAFVAAIAAAAIAIRHDSQLVAAFGLIAVLAAPPVLGASPTLVTLMFVAAALVGTTGVALFRTWIWLPPLAFVLAGPQLASYLVGDAPVAEALIAVAGFWLVNMISAGGEETRHATNRLRPTTVTLLLADAAFTLWAGFTVLDGPQESWRGSFLAALAVAHLLPGLFFLVRNGDRHPFGLVVMASGVATLTMAVPVQFGGPPVPLAWAAEAVALAWVAYLRRHPYSAAVSVLLGSLAIGHLLAIEYPARDLTDGFARTWPFVGAEGMTFGFMIAALIVSAIAVPIGWVRAGLAVVGGLVTLYVLPFELSGTALVAGWAILAVGATGLFVRIVAPRLAPDFAEARTAALALPATVQPAAAYLVALVSSLVRPSVALVGALAGLAAVAHLASLDYPPADAVTGAASAIPFVGLHGLAFAIVLAMLAGLGLLVPLASARIGLTALGGLAALYVFPFELSGPALVWAWAALATAAFAVEVLVLRPRISARLMVDLAVALVRPSVLAVGLLGGAAVLGHLVTLDFPIDRLGDRALSSLPYAGQEGVALAGALAALAAIAWLFGARWFRLGAIGVGLALFAYTVTFEIGPPWVTVAWGLAAVAAIGVVRRFARVDVVPLGQLTVASVVERLPYATADLALLFMVVQAHWYADAGSLVRLLGGALAVDGAPFLDDRTFTFLVLGATAIAIGWTWGGVLARVAGGVAAALAVAWLLPFEVRPGYAVAGWSALTLAGLAVVRLVPVARLVAGVSSVSLGVFAIVVALATVAPPDRLIVDGSTTVLGWPLLTDATVALAGLTVAIGIGALINRGEPARLPALLLAGCAGVYLLSIAVVDQFQLQVGDRPLDVLQWESQVGLSVLWSLLGGAAFATGLLTHRPPIRLSGLALLGLATVKVFAVDLATLDVEYRVLALVILGILLLVSAMAYARMQHPHPPASPKPA